jgi:hypothetical protein
MSMGRVVLRAIVRKSFSITSILLKDFRSQNWLSENCQKLSEVVFCTEQKIFASNITLADIKSIIEFLINRDITNLKTIRLSPKVLI